MLPRPITSAALSAWMAQNGAPALLLPLQIVALVLVCAPVIWSLGCVYSMVTGSPLGLSMYRIYTVLVRTPGEPQGAVLAAMRLPCMHAAGHGAFLPVCFCCGALQAHVRART